jgi:hypothetical protein
MRYLNPPDFPRDFGEMATAANLRLRFDKVAQRVIRMLQVGLTGTVPEGEGLLIAISAPVRLPSKTVTAIMALARGNLSRARLSDTVHGNDVRLRRIGSIQSHMPIVIGFVHNPSPNAELLLDLLEARLAGANTANGLKRS